MNKNNSKPKFKAKEIVIYHQGNWKWEILETYWKENGKIVYLVKCHEHDPEICPCAEDSYLPHLEVHDEKDLISYEEWCRHTEEGKCKICCG